LHAGPDRRPPATVRVSVVRSDPEGTDSPADRVYADHQSFIRLVAHTAALANFYSVEWLVACRGVEHAQAYRRLFGVPAPRSTRACSVFALRSCALAWPPTS